MIALERKRTVSAINAKFRGADKREKDKELMFAQRDFLNDPDKKVEFKSTFWKAAKTQLKNVRYSIFSKFRVIKKMYNILTADGTDEPFRKEVKKQLDDMLSNKYLFAGMNRYFDTIL